MSVTVSDLLYLPSLKQARVIAGRKGLDKTVASVSVLETIEPSNLTEDIFGTGKYIGSEIAITGFVNCADDVECQCANIRRLAEGGEVGLILFYVGIFMPYVDERLISLADELDFVLIQMPPLKNLRYSDTITDIMGCIFRDREKNESIVTDILAAVSLLPKQQRSVNTVLRMISDRVLASIVLTDEVFKIINFLSWPQGLEAQMKIQQIDLRKYSFEKLPQVFEENENSMIYHCDIYGDGGILMHLFVIKEGEALRETILEKIEDIVRISMNIWGKEHGTIAIRELIKAILQDDPIKMRRLSAIFHIDVESIHEMWIIQGKNIQQQIENVCSIVRMYAKTVIADIYEEKLILFSSTVKSEKAADEIINEIMKANDGSEIFVSRCGGLQTTGDVRRAYLCHQDYLRDAEKIYPKRYAVSLGNLEYAKSCCELIEQGEDALYRYNQYLKIVKSSSDEWNAIETLGVYLLDADMNTTKTAQELFLHNNTVKYRLKVISDALGFKPDKMPESIYLYRAIAIHRLMN